jgi:hypothetical protein
MKTQKTDIYGRPITWHDKVEWWIEDHLGKILLCLMLLGIGCFFAGCASTKANSQKTLAGIQYGADAAMKLWAGYVVREQKRADALPDGQREAAHAKLLERRLQVDDARRKFSAAWATAFAAARYDTQQPAAGQVLSLLTNLETTVNAFAK